MNIPPGSETTRREAQELAARFSTLSTEISACLDAVLGELQRAPNSARALGVARELVAAQRAVTQQLMALSHAGGHTGPQALGYAETPNRRLLPAPEPAWTTPHAAALASPDEPAGRDTAGSLLRLLQKHAVPQQDIWQPQPASYRPQDHTAGYGTPIGVKSVRQPLHQRDAGRHAHEVVPVSEAYARAPAAPRYHSPPPEPEHYANELLGEPRASEPPASAPQRRDSPLALAAMLGSAKRTSPTRIGAVTLPMLVVLGLMLNAGQRPPKPSPSQTEAVAEATSSTKPVRNAPAKMQEPLQPVENSNSDMNQPSEDGSAQAAEVAPPSQPASHHPVPGMIMTTLPEPPEPSAEGALPNPRKRTATTPDAVPSEAPQPVETSPIPAPPAPRGKPVIDPPKTAMPTAPAKPPKPLPVEAKALAPDAAKPDRNMAKIAPFKTAVVKAETGEVFVPVLIELKNEGALQQFFLDLQKRYPGSLGTKHAELRPVAGPQNEKWFALLAAPGVSKADADAVCQSLGQEGKSLGCRIIRY